MLSAYIKRIFDVAKHGDAREESYYSSLEDLVKSYAESSGKKRHMMPDNLALNTVRQTKMPEWRHAVVSNLMAPAVYVEIKDGSNLFPLYTIEIQADIDSVYPKIESTVLSLQLAN